MREMLTALRHHPTGMAGAIILLVLVLLAISSPITAPYDPIETDFSVRLQSPSRAHPFGTDDLGRDVLSRLMAGGRISLRAGVVAVAIASVWGTVIGVVSGFYGGLVDSTIMRLIDVAMAMPGILLSMVFIFTLGPSLTNVMIAVGLASIPSYARLARGSVLSARENAYVDAARVLGAPDRMIMFRHILPNIVAPILVVATLGLGSAILSIAGLSFLGLGAQPPTPEWGVIISDGRARLATAWWISTFGGLVIMLSVLAINLLGDALRDVMDPRLRTR
jgi:ABC-type dipeptide/oligopeptide/nickel transport system permease subunit